ncbi:hypothetical protein [Peristeroidobacter soli]|uniref:hypothetical protein n=1 Tax=Peristeroidobacter soli TaxID=2497877 RepID=UPI0013008BF3|nr:hypothetical protein [Peristeroidobacter soli]
MRKIWIVLFCMLGGAIAACAAEPPMDARKVHKNEESAVQEQPGSAGTTTLGHPVIRAELLTVNRGTIIDLVVGTAFITRQDREAIQIHGALPLEEGDLLQIHSDSTVRLRSPDGKEIELRREHGEWFRFSIRGN